MITEPTLLHLRLIAAPNSCRRLMTILTPRWTLTTISSLTRVDLIRSSLSMNRLLLTVLSDRFKTNSKTPISWSWRTTLSSLNISIQPHILPRKLRDQNRFTSKLVGVTLPKPTCEWSSADKVVSQGQPRGLDTFTKASKISLNEGGSEALNPRMLRHLVLQSDLTARTAIIFLLLIIKNAESAFYAA